MEPAQLAAVSAGLMVAASALSVDGLIAALDCGRSIYPPARRDRPTLTPGRLETSSERKDHP